MAVAIIAVDTWITHLPFSSPRPSSFGMIDGIFYGVVSGDGDNTGGNFTLNGQISFNRKEDWIYVIQNVSLSRNDVLAGENGFIVAATGPLIPTASAVANPSFHSADENMKDITNNVVTIFTPNSPAPFNGMPSFGDKKIAGPLALIAAGLETNTDAVTYQLSIWGFLITYRTFFRGVSPAVG